MLRCYYFLIILSVVNFAQLNFVILAILVLLQANVFFCKWNFLSVCKINCFSRNVSIIIIMPLVFQVKVLCFAVDLLSSVKTRRSDYDPLIPYL